MNTKSMRVVRVLGVFLKKKYPNFRNDVAISLIDLLEWDPWPGFLKIHNVYGKC